MKLKSSMWQIVGMLVLIAVIVGVVALVHISEEDCTKAGGVLVRTSRAYECILGVKRL